MILTKEVILENIQKGIVKIEPFEKGAVGPASIDLTLDSEIRVFVGKKTIDEDLDYTKITKIVNITKGYILKPGELVLGITKEKITLPPNLCAWLNSRSRYARIGLMSHITAPFIMPGTSNKQVLEIFNAGKNKIKLISGTKICQLVLQECKGNAVYQGRYKNQSL
jgi:dCTP deaminase